MTPVATQKPEIDLVSEGWAEYWENPVRFVGDFFGVTPEPYQADILDAVAEFPSVAVRSGHGVGKTAIASWAAPWFLVTRPMSRVMTTAPTFQKQVRDLLWAEIHKWIRRSPLASELNRSKVRLSIPGFDEEWFAVGVAASSPENMEGPHADYLFYVIDEAKGVPDDIFEGIAGTQTTEAKQLLISTPGAQLGHFHRVFTKLRTTWKTFHVPSVGRWGAPRSGDGDGATASVAESAVADTAKDSIPRKAIGWNEPDAPPISARIRPGWVADRIEDWGVDSPVFQARVLGEFPDEDEDTLIGLSFIEAAEGREVIEGARLIRRTVGVDVARYGRDFTVYTVADFFETPDTEGDATRVFSSLRAMKRQAKKGVVEVASEAKRIFEEHGADVIAVDDTGVGGGVTDVLEADGIETLPVTFGAGAADRDHFLNLKAELFWNLRNAFRAGDVSLARKGGGVSAKDRDTLTAQLSGLKYQMMPKGPIRILDPDDPAIRKRSVARGPAKSPDHAHSFGLAWWAGAKAGTGRIRPGARRPNRSGR